MATFNGLKIGWDFIEHGQNINPATSRPFLGGTDLIQAPREEVLAFKAGRVTTVTAHSVVITPPLGNRLLVIELGKVLVREGQLVTAGTVIALAGTKWPHYVDITPAGTHVRSSIFNAIPDPLAPTPPPPAPIKDDDMLYFALSTTPMTFCAIGVTGIETAVSATEWAALWAKDHDGPVSTAQKQLIKDVVLRVAPATVGGGYSPADADVVDEGELGQALTSQSQLIIQDLTPKITAVGAKVAGLGISHS